MRQLLFMVNDQKIIVVMPAYNAEKTLRKTYEEVMSQGIVDLIILVDDASRDDTAKIAATFPRTKVHIHDRNQGYGVNQKTCYRLALEAGGDIIINFIRSTTYGLGCVQTVVPFRLCRMGLIQSPLFPDRSRRDSGTAELMNKS
jgi:glycosyltransferase involved in cell wall biosynthesis